MDRLPPHIIEYIIAHTTGRGRLVPGLLTNTYTPAVPHALFPLMGVCQKWRDIAKRFIGEPAIVFVNSRKPTPQGKSEHVYHLRDVIAARLEQRVRHLLLDFTVEEIRDGVAYSMFDSLVSQYKGKFRNVHTITLHTSLRDSYYWVYNRQTGVPVINLQDLANMEKEVSQNARRIGDLVREAMPNVVSVAYLGPYNHTLDSTCLNCAILSALLAAAPSIQYLSIPVGELSRTILDNVLVPNITQMHVFLPVGKSDGITELAIRYADRLETLSVDAIDDESFIMLFKSPADESPVVYSKLHTFKLTRSNFWTRGEDSYTLKINPFPKLRQFICKGNFPFATSNVFRWIQSTVEVMKAHLLVGMYKTFVREGVFATGSYPNLRYMDLAWSLPRDRFMDIDLAWELRRLVSLSPVLEKGIFKACTTSPKREVTDMSTHGFVKELNLAGIQYTIVETVHLIKRLPALQLLVLMLKSSNDVNERGDITDADIERFQQRYVALGNSRFKRLCVRCNGFCSYSRAAHHILLLASIFRSVEEIRVCSEYRDSTRDILAAFDTAKNRKSFDSNGCGRIRSMSIAVIDRKSKWF